VPDQGQVRFNERSQRLERWVGSRWAPFDVTPLVRQRRQAAAAAPGGVSDHDDLGNLGWTAGAHTGPANRLAGFDGSGDPDFYEIGADVQAYDADLDALAAFSGSVWSDEADPGTNTLIAPSFFPGRDQTEGEFTAANNYDPGSAGITGALTPRGLTLSIPGPAAGTRLAGRQSTTNPFGQDLLIAACFCLAGLATSSLQFFGVGMSQGTGANDDHYMVRMRSTVAAGNIMSAATFTSHTAGSNAADQGFTNGPAWIAISYRSSDNAIVSWIGSDPYSLQQVDARTLAFTPTKILIGGSGGANVTAQGTLIGLAIKAEAYSTVIPDIMFGARAA